MPVKNVKRRTNDGFEGTITGLTDEEKNILNSAISTGDNYIVKSLTLFAVDEIYALVDEIQKNPENEEIKVWEKHKPVVLEGFNGSVKRIIVDLSDITSSNTDHMIFNCGVNSIYFGQVTASFSWFTGTSSQPCMNIFALTIGYADGKYVFGGFRIWHSGYSALKSSNN